MDRRDRSQLDAISEIVARVVGDRVVGSYFYGSGVLASLRPNSDIDVFVLLGGSTEDGERQRLVRGLMDVSGPDGAVSSGRPVEVTMARLDDLRPWPAEPRREFQYGEWLRDMYRDGYVPGPVVDPDLAAQIATLLTASHPLVGPPAADLLDPVPEKALTDSMLRTVPSLVEELDDDTVNVLLTLARIGYTTTSGRIVTKDVAAEWALTGLSKEAGGPLAYAVSSYLGESQEQPAGFKMTARQTANELIANIEARP